jgi:hypothetical protein
VNPGYFITYGPPVPELVHVGRDLRRRLAPRVGAEEPAGATLAGDRSARRAVTLMAGKFDALMARRGEIMRRALGMDYDEFELTRSPSTTSA